MKKLFLILSLLLMTAHAYAEWILVDADKNNKYYVDATSSKKEGKLIKTPAYINHNKITKDTPYLSEGLMMEFDCKENQLRVIFFAPYKKHNLEGEPEDSMRIDDARWMPASNKGLGAMFNKVCKV